MGEEQLGLRLAALAKLVEATPVEKLPGLLDLAAVAPDKEACAEVRHLIYEKWTDGDPKGALTYAVAAGPLDSQGNNLGLGGALAAWARINPTAALAGARGLTPSMQALWAVQKVFASWLENDSDTALQTLAKYTPVDDRIAVQRAIMEQVSYSQPEEMFRLLQVADALTLKNLATAGIPEAFSIWAHDDPEVALTYAQRLSEAAVRRSALQGVFAGWSRADGEKSLAAFHTMQKEHPSFSQGLFTKDLITELATLNPETALAWMEAAPLALQVYGRNLVFDAWSKIDPRAAATNLMAMPASSARNKDLSAVAANWAHLDAASAFTWSQSLPDASLRTNALTEVIRSAAKDNPTAALVFLDAIPPGTLRNRLYSDVITREASGDPETALAWVQQLPPGRTTDDAMVSVVKELSKIDPVRSAEVLTTLSIGPGTLSAYANLASAWMAKDPAATLAWLATLPTDQNYPFPSANPGISLKANWFVQQTWTNVAQAAYGAAFMAWTTSDLSSAASFAMKNAGNPIIDKMIPGVASVWGAKDPEAALTWAQQLPGGKAADAAVYHAVQVVATENGPLAWNGATKISELELRNSAEALVLQTWGRLAPVEALAQVASVSDLPTQDNFVQSIVQQWIGRDPAAVSQWIRSLPANFRYDAIAKAIHAASVNDDQRALLTEAVNDLANRSRPTQ